MERAKITREQKAKKRKRNTRKLVGATFLLLACLGVYFIASLVVERVQVALDDTDERSHYSSLYASLVALDPVEFDSIEKANQNMLLEAAIWTTLSFEDNTKYERNEYEAILLPAIDVERYITKMYGSSFAYEHHTFDDYGIQFVYDEASQRYTIPITSNAGSYVAEVTSIVKTGNTKVLTVAYNQYDSSTLSAGNSGNSQENKSVAKSMEYVLIKEDGDYYLYSIRTPQVQPKADEK